MVILDTSALIRFFTNDIPSKAKEIKKLIDNSDEIYIPDVVLPELEYVLMGEIYNAKRSNVVKVFEFLKNNRNINLSNEASTAIETYAKTNFDMADCIIIATAKNGSLFSYDKKLINQYNKDLR